MSCSGMADIARLRSYSLHCKDGIGIDVEDSRTRASATWGSRIVLKRNDCFLHFGAGIGDAKSPIV